MALSEQQKHLINRLPNWYEVRSEHAPKEPVQVSKARKIIGDWEERTSKERKDREQRFKKALNDTREAIYFLPADKALVKVKAFESEFGTK
jgi:hypothetical protein